MPFGEGFPKTTPISCSPSQPHIHHQVSIHHMCIFLSITLISESLSWGMSATPHCNSIKRLLSIKLWEFLPNISNLFKLCVSMKSRPQGPWWTIQTSWSNEFPFKICLQRSFLMNSALLPHSWVGFAFSLNLIFEFLFCPSSPLPTYDSRTFIVWQQTI